MTDELPPFDEEIEALLQDERAALAPPIGARARVGSRLASTLGITLAIGGAAEVAGEALGGGDVGPDPLGGVDPLTGADPSALGAGAEAIGHAPDVVSQSITHGADAALQAASVAGAKAAVSTGAATTTAAGAGAAASTAGASSAVAAAGAATAGTAATATVASGAAATGIVALLAKPLVIGAFVAGTMVGGGTVAVVQPQLAEAVEVRQASGPTSPTQVEQASADIDAPTGELDELDEAVADDGFEIPEADAPPPRARKPQRRTVPRKRVARAAPVEVDEATDEGVEAPVPEVEPIPPPAREAEPASDEEDEEQAPPAEDEPALEVLPPEAPAADAPRGRSKLAREQALLEVARTALSRRNPVQALTALQEHEARFPRASLTEEREVLFILALLGAGREDEAKDRAATFKERYPRSMQMPIVDGALR